MTQIEDGKQIASGTVVFPTDDKISGTIRYLGSTQDVLEAIDEYNLDETIGLVRSGTCSFASPLLSNNIHALLTMEGAAESHLGILSREYKIPAIMSVNPEDGLNYIDGEEGSDEYFENLAQTLQSRKVRLNCSDSEGTRTGTVIELS